MPIDLGRLSTFLMFNSLAVAPFIATTMFNIANNLVKVYQRQSQQFFVYIADKNNTI